MKFWFRFYQEGEWTMAYCPDLDVLTQGRDDAEIVRMAEDLLVCSLEDWSDGEDVSVSTSHPDEPGDWRLVDVPMRPFVAMLIRRERKRQRLTMQQVADRLGVKLGTYQRFEDARRSNLTMGNLEKILKAIGQEMVFSFAAKAV